MPLKVGENQIQTGLKNLETIAASVPVVILEHHILRDENWQEKTTNVFYSAYKSGHTVQTGAEFVGKRNVFLEACRKRLFADAPPSEEFKVWMRLGEETRRHVKPSVEI